MLRNLEGAYSQQLIKGMTFFKNFNLRNNVELRI